MSRVPTNRVRFHPYRTGVVCTPPAAHPVQQFWSSVDLPAEFWRGCMPNQQPNFVAMPPAAARPSGVQIHSPQQARVQGVGRAYTGQGTRGGPQMPSNPRHSANPQAVMTVYHHGGGPHSIPLGGTHMTSKPGIPCQSWENFHATQNQRITSQTTQSLNAYVCARQSNLQAASPPQQLPVQNQELSKLWSTQAKPSLPAFEVSVKDASPSDTSSVRSETGSKKTPSAKEPEPCPVTKCSRKYFRRQELERHILENHVELHCIYCDQPGCDWTGSRRYELTKHLVHKHAEVTMPEKGVYMIYDPKELVKRLLSKDINVEQAVGEAQSLYQKKAVELGKLGIWKGTKPPGL